MSNAALITSSKSAMSIFLRSKGEVEQARRSGNFSLETNAQIRMAVATMSTERVKGDLLKIMGIAADVSPVGDGMMIEVRTPQSLQAVMNALRSTFDVLGAMGSNGRMAVKVMIPNELKIS